MKLQSLSVIDVFIAFLSTPLIWGYKHWNSSQSPSQLYQVLSKVQFLSKLLLTFCPQPQWHGGTDGAAPLASALHGLISGGLTLTRSEIRISNTFVRVGSGKEVQTFRSDLKESLPTDHSCRDWHTSRLNEACIARLWAHKCTKKVHRIHIRNYIWEWLHRIYSGSGRIFPLAPFSRLNPK